jgi:hypothetical protein
MTATEALLALVRETVLPHRMSKPLTDYEKYIRTAELLALQKPPEQLSCYDELQFQIVA